MKFNPEIHHRRSIRLNGYDYAGDGAYFVTICVQGRECLFGKVAEGDVRLNPAGEIVKDVWERLPERFPAIVLDQFVVMPNHFHGIIVMNDVGALLAAPRMSDVVTQGAASGAPTLGGIMRAFKSVSAITINRLRDNSGVPVWQRNYYERILRNDGELDRARRYIRENPLKWDSDRENPVNVRP